MGGKGVRREGKKFESDRQLRKAEFGITRSSSQLQKKLNNTKRKTAARQDMKVAEDGQLEKGE